MANLEYLIENEVMPVLKDIADSLKKIANPLLTMTKLPDGSYDVGFGRQIQITDVKQHPEIGDK